MAVSLEARVPMLDHRLIEFAAALPQSFKIRGGKQKWMLRKILDRFVPAHLVDKPKMGFGVPLASWMRGPLRNWVEDLISEDSLKKASLTPAPIRSLAREHLSGRVDASPQLWNVLSYLSWRAKQSSHVR
jgi:asparagine synthase (glutamine-hydrolysing)